MNNRIKKQRDMLLRDTIKLIKKDGTEIESIKANVQAERIIIHRSDILIESGDLLIREMSNGGEETYEVIDPRFYEKGHFDAHYQSVVKKLGLQNENKPVQNNTTIYQYGNNSRVNQDSIDNSVNTVNDINSIMKYIDELRKEIQNIANTVEEKTEYLELVDAVQEQLESEKPKKSVIKSILNSLPKVASITSIIQLILSLV